MFVRASMLVVSAGLALMCSGVFADAAVASRPAIDNEWVTGVTPTNATLNAEINPNGLLTKYKLQIDTTGNFNFFQTDSCPLHPPGIVCAQVIVPGEPLPPGVVEPPESTLSGGIESQHVSVNMASIGATLQPGTTYHYRAIAANSAGFEYGSDLTFTTPLGTRQPSIESEAVSSITQKNATLEAEIDPGGLKTSYRFRLAYGCGLTPGEVCPQYCIAELTCPGPWNSVIPVPLPSGSLPASFEAQHVSLDLNEIGVMLEPYKYRYSVEATNSAGAVEGPDQFFAPPPQLVVDPLVELALNVEEGEGTVISSPAGIECGVTCKGEFEEGSKITLTASPASGYAFRGWRHCDSGGVNGRQCTMTMSLAKEVDARFVKVWNLSASKVGTGLGLVQVPSGGIACVYSCTEAEAEFKEGSITIKQAAATHNHFVHWLGDCMGTTETCVLSMSEDHAVAAEFAPDTKYVLSLAKKGGGQGIVKTKPSGIICDFTCSGSEASFYEGESISIGVKLGKGTTKLTWATGAGTCIGSTELLESTCTVKMDEARSLIAKFD